MKNSHPEMTRSEKATKKAFSALRKKQFLLIGCIALVACLVFGFGGFLLYNHYMENRTIEANITIAGVPVQGMTRKEVSEAVSEAFLLSHRGKQMVIKVGEETVTLTSDITGVHLDTDALAKAAMKVTSDDSQQVPFPVTDYVQMDEEKVMPILQAVTDKLQSTLTQHSYQVTGKAPESYTAIDETCSQKITFKLGTPGISVDPALIYDAILSAYAQGNFSFEYSFPIEEPDALDLEKIFSEECVAAINAVVDTETWKISDESLGYGFDTKAASEALETASYGDSLSFDFIWLEPADTKESLTNAMFCDVLGQATASSGWDANRNTNIRLSSNAVNGTILLPGEIFSFNNTTGKRTAEKGYKEGGAYIGGEVVQAIGGGICQVSSAIYYASVIADMEIIERYKHAYATGYLPNGTDATVSWGALDFRFRNNSDRPIKIEVIPNGGTVTVRILGVETRDYYVKFISQHIRTIPYETKEEVYAPDNAEGYTDGQVISKSSPCNGYECKSYRNKYDRETNKLISSTLENHDTYGKRDKVVVKIVDPNPPDDTTDTTPGTPVTPPDDTTDTTPGTPVTPPNDTTDTTPGTPVTPPNDTTDTTPGTPVTPPDSGSEDSTPPSGSGGVTEDGN